MNFIAVQLFATFFQFTVGALVMNETRLHAELFQGYNKQAHPKLSGTGPVIIIFDFQLIRILDVSAKQQHITTYAWVNQYWDNDLLKWDPRDYGGVKEIHIAPESIWVPDTLLYNNIDEEDRVGGGRTTYTNNVALQYDGRCTWLNPAMFRSICSVDVTNFPFDDQECELKFGSWAFDASKIDMTVNNDTVANRYYITNGEWKMLNLSVKRNSLKYQCCPHEFVDITITVKIRRESLDYILKLLIPCSLISSMIFLGFVLPPESGERIGLSITVLLAMTVFQQLSSELMPSYGFPLLGQFYFAIMLEIGASLAVTTLILNFYHRNRRRMPKTMRKVILHWLARILFPCQKPKDWSEVRRKSNALRRAMDSIDVESKGQVSCSGSEESCGDDQLECQTGKFLRHDERMHTWVVQDSGKVDTISTNGDPSNGFGSFCNPGASPTNNCKQNGGIKKEPKGFKSNRNFRRSGAKKASKKKRPSNASILRRQLTIDSMSAPFGGNVLDWTEEKLKNQKEWIKAARVLDRLFLILSIVVTMVTLLTIFLRAPRFRLE